MTTISKENFVLLFTISTETRKQSSAIENVIPTIHVAVKAATRLLFFLAFRSVRNCSETIVEINYLPFSFLKIYGPFGVLVIKNSLAK